MQPFCLLQSCGIITFFLDVGRYWLPKGPSNVLTVHVMENEELGDALWRTPGVPSAGWEVAEVTVSSRGGKNGLYVRLSLF